MFQLEPSGYELSAKFGNGHSTGGRLELAAGGELAGPGRFAYASTMAMRAIRN